jgi:hypothetical protein
MSVLAQSFANGSCRLDVVFDDEDLRHGRIIAAPFHRLKSCRFLKES